VKLKFYFKILKNCPQYWFEDYEDNRELMQIVISDLFRLFSNKSFSEFFLSLFVHNSLESKTILKGEYSYFWGKNKTWTMNLDIVEKIIESIENLRNYKNDKIFIGRMKKEFLDNEDAVKVNIDYTCNAFIRLILECFFRNNKQKIVVDELKFFTGLPQISKRSDLF
jgi:hypothetical protein